MNFTHNTFIQWFNAAEVKPSKDGNYLCMTTPGRITVLRYGAKHQLFNVTEDCTDYAINVAWWAPIPELPYKEDENEA
jgi:hypothetical protein